jgi:hypothetical protein
MYRLKCEYRLVEGILDPHSRVGQRHLENVCVDAGFGYPRKGLVDRTRYNARIGNAAQHVVLDLDRDGQLVPTVESHAITSSSTSPKALVLRTAR